MTNEVFKQFIELFDDMRIGNNYYNLNCIYNPYTKQDEEPYWLCSLHWIPHELHKHIVDINFYKE